MNLPLQTKREILDRIAGASVSYGLVRLSKEHNGPCLRVRRASDSEELDIGFIGSRDKINLVNVLGSSGNFELDSNSDGLANGFSKGAIAALSVIDNTQNFTATAQYGSIYVGGSTYLPANHIMYACGYIKVPAGYNTARILLGDGTGSYNRGVVSGNGDFQFKSAYLKAINSGAVFRVDDSAVGAWQQISVKQLHLIDLTKIFGSGYEPTQVQLDLIIAFLISTYGYITERTIMNVWSSIVSGGFSKLDTESLLTFVAGGDGYISKWYSQAPLGKCLVRIEIPYDKTTWAEWIKTNITAFDISGVTLTPSTVTRSNMSIVGTWKPNIKYGCLFEVVSNTVVGADNGYYFRIGGSSSSTFEFGSNSLSVGVKKFTAITPAVPTTTFNLADTGLSIGACSGSIKLKDIRVFELIPNSQIEADFTNLTAEQLSSKYPFGSSFETRLTNHAMQSVAANQPKLVINGIIEDGILYDGINDLLSVQTIPLDTSKDFTIYAVVEVGPNSTGAIEEAFSFGNKSTSNPYFTLCISTSSDLRVYLYDDTGLQTLVATYIPSSQIPGKRLIKVSRQNNTIILVDVLSGLKATSAINLTNPATFNKFTLGCRSKTADDRFFSKHQQVFTCMQRVTTVTEDKYVLNKLKEGGVI